MRLGQRMPAELRERLSRARTGRKLSDETRRKMSLSRKGLKSYVRTEEIRVKQSRSKMGQTPTEETRRKLSASRRGDKNPNWRGGLTTDTEKRVSSYTWRRLRKMILIRDNYTCQRCERTQLRLQVHHKMPVRLGGKDCHSNLVSLCYKCHHKVEWTFRKIVEPYILGVQNG